MLQIASINLSAMTNGANIKFHQTASGAAKADAALATAAAEKVAAYELAYKQLDADFQTSRKSLETDDIVAADRKRDLLYSAYKKAVRGYLAVPEDSILKAAKALDQQITDYGIDTAMDLNRESGLLDNLCRDHTEKYAAEIETLGLKKMSDTLKAANDEVISLMASRTEERSTKVVGALRKSRTAADTAYKELIQLVNALIVVNGETDYAAFANLINTEIEYYKQNSLAKKGSKTPDNTPTE